MACPPLPIYTLALVSANCILCPVWVQSIALEDIPGLVGSDVDGSLGVVLSPFCHYAARCIQEGRLILLDPARCALWCYLILSYSMWRV